MDEMLIYIGVGVSAVVGGLFFLLRPSRPTYTPPSSTGVSAVREAHVEEIRQIEEVAEEKHEELEKVAVGSDSDVRKGVNHLIIFLLAVLVGCAARQPVPLTLPEQSLPEMEVRKAPQVDLENECIKAVVEPGKRPSFVDEHGVATCGGQLVPTDRVLELLHAEIEAERWKRLAQAERRARRVEFGLVASEARLQWERVQQERKYSDWHRLTGGAKIVVGVVLGVALDRLIPE